MVYRVQKFRRPASGSGPRRQYAYYHLNFHLGAITLPISCLQAPATALYCIVLYCILQNPLREVSSASIVYFPSTLLYSWRGLSLRRHRFFTVVALCLIPIIRKGFFKTFLSRKVGQDLLRPFAYYLLCSHNCTFSR